MENPRVWAADNDIKIEFWFNQSTDNLGLFAFMALYLILGRELFSFDYEVGQNSKPYFVSDDVIKAKGVVHKLCYCFLKNSFTIYHLLFLSLL